MILMTSPYSSNLHLPYLSLSNCICLAVHLPLHVGVVGLIVRAAPELTKRRGKRQAPTPFAATALDEIGAGREVARDDEAAHQRQIAKQAQMAAKKLQQRHAEQAEEQARRAHLRPDLASTSPSRPSHHPAISARSRQAEIAQLEARLKVAEARRQRELV